MTAGIVATNATNAARGIVLTSLLIQRSPNFNNFRRAISLTLTVTTAR